MQNSAEHQIILASKSPRRKYLLDQAGIKFSIIPSTFNEASVPLRDPEDYVKTLAKEKASEIGGLHPDSWIIGADTVVLINGHLLGKPKSREEAGKMLLRLSGKIHQVLTGFAILCVNRNRFYSDVVRTDVRFKNLSAAEIEWYIHTNEPFDKAGAYAIQGLGTFLVRRINGSYTNVVGLPVCEVIEILLREKILEIDTTPSEDCAQ